MKKSPIEPLGDKVVMQVVEEVDQMYGNIVIPDMGTEKPIMGEVLAVGPGRLSPEGKLVKQMDSLKAGVRVLIPVFGAQRVTLNNEEYILASSNDILGIVNLDDNE